MLTAQEYERAAQQYLESLPLEHFMEATPQARQRAITTASFEQLEDLIPGFRYFNELLLQGELEDGTLIQVVPDNMTIMSNEPERKRTSYPVKLEKSPPFWVLEYVSQNNKRKDYEDNFKKYEEVFQIPYHLLFDPETKDLRLHRYNGEGYVRMEPDDRGRYLIDELELVVGQLDGWLRFWYRGELLAAPKELRQDRERLRQTLAERVRDVELQADLIEHKDEIIADQAQQLASRQAELSRLQEQQRQAALGFQGLVAERASRAGRQDILARLEQTTDLAQLLAWLAELS